MCLKLLPALGTPFLLLGYLDQPPKEGFQFVLLYLVFFLFSLKAYCFLKVEREWIWGRRELEGTGKGGGQEL